MCDGCIIRPEHGMRRLYYNNDITMTVSITTRYLDKRRGETVTLQWRREM